MFGFGKRVNDSTAANEAVSSSLLGEGFQKATAKQIKEAMASFLKSDKTPPDELRRSALLETTRQTNEREGRDGKEVPYRALSSDERRLVLRQTNRMIAKRDYTQSPKPHGKAGRKALRHAVRERARGRASQDE